MDSHRETQATEPWQSLATLLHQRTGGNPLFLVKLSLDQGFAFYFAHGTILRRGARAEQGREEEGIMQLRQGLAALRTTGAALRLPCYLSTLAVTYARRRQGEEAASLLTRAPEVMHKNEERGHEAELHRLKGELTLKQSEVRGPKSPLLSP
ncbi:MAG: hypothetical protein HY268_18430 [Deltaproteobacteria bacterium]|nr:hypothetical protein [Deltaproteobacteria bacterium]